MSSVDLEAPPRDRLLAAAFGLIDDEVSLSMDAVAQAAGVSRASAYRIFAGIREITDVLAEAQARQHVADVLVEADREADAVSKLEAIVVYTVTTGRNDPRLRYLMPQAGIGAGALTQRLAVDVAEPIIVAGQHAGELRADVNPGQITAWLLDSFVSGTSYRSMSETEARAFFRTFFVPALVPATAGLKAELEPVERQLRAALAVVEKARMKPWLSE